MNAPETRGAVQEVLTGVAGSDGRDDAPASNSNQASAALPMPGAIESIPTHPPCGTPFTKERARELTDQIRVEAQGVRALMLRAYEGSAHVALGYKSFLDYARAEFGMEPRTAERTLNAGRVEQRLGDQLVANEAPLKESVAREFTSLIEQPEKLRDAYIEARNNSRDVDGRSRPPTAKAVREAAHKRLAPRAGEETKPAAAIEKSKPAIGLNVAVAALRYAVEHDREAAPSALATLREVASHGLYGPQTKDPVAAFRDLIDIVARLLERQL